MWRICSSTEYLLSLEMIKIMDGTQITERQTDRQRASQPGIYNTLTQCLANENEKEIPI